MGQEYTVFIIYHSMKFGSRYKVGKNWKSPRPCLCPNPSSGQVPAEGAHAFTNCPTTNMAGVLVPAGPSIMDSKSWALGSQFGTSRRCAALDPSHLAEADSPWAPNVTKLLCDKYNLANSLSAWHKYLTARSARSPYDSQELMHTRILLWVQQDIWECGIETNRYAK